MTDAAIETAVELGRQAPDCERHGGAWCSCKVRWFAAALVDGGHMVPAGVEETWEATAKRWALDADYWREREGDAREALTEARAVLDGLVGAIEHRDRKWGTKPAMERARAFLAGQEQP